MSLGGTYVTTGTRAPESARTGSIASAIDSAVHAIAPPVTTFSHAVWKQHRDAAVRAHKLALDREQRRVAQQALSEARAMRASRKDELAMIAAGLVESHLRNLSYGDADSLGFLQQRPSQGWAHATSVKGAAHDFLKVAKQLDRQYATPGALAQGVQRSRYPERYAAKVDRAVHILHALADSHSRGIARGPG